jgi:enoyl-CoA hydratase/carnithine racemase
VSFDLIEPHIGKITLDRPQVLNALDFEAMEAFAAAVARARNAAPRALLIAGAGERAFCTGGDLKSLHQFPTEADGWRVTSGMTDALALLEALPFPTIAVINGHARGGGAEITLACDLRLAAAHATFGFTHVSLGLTPGWGSGQRLLRLAGYARAFEWITTSRILSADELLAERLVNRVLPSAELAEAALSLARQFAALPPAALASAKRLLRAGVHLPPPEAAQVEQAAFPPLWAAEEHLRRAAAFVHRKSS